MEMWLGLGSAMRRPWKEEKNSKGYKRYIGLGSRIQVLYTVFSWGFGRMCQVGVVMENCEGIFFSVGYYVYDVRMTWGYTEMNSIFSFGFYSFCRVEVRGAR